MNIPEVINNYKAYDNDSKQIVGIGDEMPIPDFESITATVNGAGITGEFEDPVIGQFKSTEMEIPFRTLIKDMFSMMRTDKALNLTIRGAQQELDTESGETVMTPVRIVVRGKFKSFTGGSMKVANGTSSKVKMELWYILIEVNGTTSLELDKFNQVFVVDGVDQLAKLKEFC